VTPSHRAWAERFVGDLEAKIILHEGVGTGREGEAVILSCLRAIIVRHRDALAAAPITVAQPTSAVPVAPVSAGPAGAAEILTGTWRQRMLRSAETMRSAGQEAVAQNYEAHAARARPDGSRPDDDQPAAATAIDEAAQRRLAAVATFSAGPQLAMF
jgi:hypothetical protein